MALGEGRKVKGFWRPGLMGALSLQLGPGGEKLGRGGGLPQEGGGAETRQKRGRERRG